MPTGENNDSGHERATIAFSIRKNPRIFFKICDSDRIDTSNSKGFFFDYA